MIGDDDLDVTIFQQPWWLDAVSDGRYRAISAGDANSYIWWPYLERRWLGFTVIDGPLFSHTLGPVIRTPRAKLTSQVSQRRKLINAALEQFPRAQGFSQVLDASVDNAFDYVMAGFEVGVRYTFHVPTAAASEEALWGRLKDKARNSVRRARQFYDVGHGMSVMDFHRLYERNLSRTGHPNHHPREVYARLAEALAVRDRHVVMTARSHDSGEIVAATLVVWDRRYLYYLRATHDGTNAARIASGLLLWEAIKLAAELHLTFDSDTYYGRRGAAIIEAFGGEPVERLVISRRTDLLKLGDAARWRLQNLRRRALK